MIFLHSFQFSDVIRYFNVAITAEDIFVRCSLCNGNVYITIPQAEMRRLREMLRTRADAAKRNVGAYGVEEDYDIDPDCFDDGERKKGPSVLHAWTAEAMSKT
jgi:hypothetical protein